MFRPLVVIITALAGLAAVCLLVNPGSDGSKTAALKSLITDAISGHWKSKGVEAGPAHWKAKGIEADIQQHTPPALRSGSLWQDAAQLELVKGEKTLGGEKGMATSVLELATEPGDGTGGNPGATQGSAGGAGGYMGRIITQAVFTVIYYFLIVKKYPPLNDATPTAAAIALQEKNAVLAVCDSSFANCFHSYCCSGPRAAHTFNSVGIMEFIPGALLMILCPCCTLFYMNSCTELNVKLGGTQQSMFLACLCSFCCSCCLIAQDAESLDLITGCKTELCGVQGGALAA